MDTELAENLDEQAFRQTLQMQFAQRLNLALDKCEAVPAQGRGRVEAVAAYLGVSISTAQRLLSGTVLPEAHRLAKIADKLGVTTDYLLGSASLEEARRNVRERLGQVVPVTEQHYVTIPILNPDESWRDEAYFHVPRSHIARFIQPVGSAALIVMRGDSMAPTACNGELMLILASPCLSPQPLAEGLYPLRYRGGTEWTLRRLQAVSGGQYRVSCDNPAYPPELVPCRELAEDGGYEWTIGGILRTILKRY